MTQRDIWWIGEHELLFREGERFARIGPSGLVAEWYGERSYSDEDDLWTWVYAVVGDELRARTTVMHGRHPPTVKEESVVLRGLVADDSPRAKWLVDTALVAYEAGRRVEKKRSPPPRIDDDIERARAALAQQVREPTRDSLLETLGVIANAPAAVRTAVARGCLLYCASGDAPALPAPPVCSPDPALAARLANHAAQFERQAEWFIDSDSHGNARTCFAAATAMREAARWLGYTP